MTYTFSPMSGPAGTEVTVTGSGCPDEPNVTRTGRFDIFRSVDGAVTGPVLGFATFRSDAHGNFSARTSGLVEGPLGQHRTVVSCTGGTTSSGAFTLTAAAPVPVSLPGHMVTFPPIVISNSAAACSALHTAQATFSAWMSSFLPPNFLASLTSSAGC